MMCNINWSEAPDWATCVVKPKINKFSVDYHWSEEPRVDARMMRIETGADFTMRSEIFWEIVEKRPCGPATPVKTKLLMTPKARGNTYEEFIATGWNDDQLVEHGYAIRITDKRSWSPMTVGTETITPPSNCRCTFTPVQQPSTASDLLKQAEQLLTERGKQYDTSGQERSSAKIVAAFNTITGRDLTPGEGWLFLMLLKAVRFYSNTETPHRDSLEDLISYAALHAEEYLNDER